MQTSLFTWAAAFANAGVLPQDDQVLFLPGTARVLESGKVEARIDAWVFEREARPGLTRVFAKYLGLDLDAITLAQRELFYQRTQLFRVDSQNAQALTLDFGADQRLSLPSTRMGGRAQVKLSLTASTEANAVSWLDYSLTLGEGDSRRFVGRTLVVPPIGLSVVSDIDDTIKQSNVQNRKVLLMNTFAREFLAVPCMAMRYQQIAASTHAPSFHYLSASPIQLYPPLAEFLAKSGFPAGSVHLRESTSIRNAIPEHGESRIHKLSVLRTLLADFPERGFMLIGDSGEFDPEIYGEIVREFSQRQISVRIRDVTGDTRDSPRYRKAFADINAQRWTLFGDAPAWQTLGTEHASADASGAQRCF